MPWLPVSARGLLHPPGEAQAVAREFIEAWREGDQAALARLCAPTAEVDMAGSGLGPQLGALRFDMEVAPRLVGSRARVPFVLTASDGPGVAREAEAEGLGQGGEVGEVGVQGDGLAAGGAEGGVEVDEVDERGGVRGKGGEVAQHGGQIGGVAAGEGDARQGGEVVGGEGHGGTS